jgi:hypothetical protein
VYPVVCPHKYLRFPPGGAFPNYKFLPIPLGIPQGVLNRVVLITSKGSLTRDFRLPVFCHVSVSPSILLAPCFNFFENLQRYLRMNDYHRCQQHRRKVVHRFSPVSLTPAVNPSHKFSVILPVSTTLAIKLLPVTHKVRSMLRRKEVNIFYNF